MAVNLAGRVMDDQGNGVNGASISIYLMGSPSPAATVSTANDTSGQPGYWAATGLANGEYIVKATYQGKVRGFYGASEVQFNRVIVGNDYAEIGPLGDVTLTHSAAVTDGAAVDSPQLRLVAGYDSNGAAGQVTDTDLGMGLRCHVDNAGNYHLSIRNNADQEVGLISPTGAHYFTASPNGAAVGYVGQNRDTNLTLEQTLPSSWLRLGGPASGQISFWANGNASIDDSPQMWLDSSGGLHLQGQYLTILDPTGVASKYVRVNAADNSLEFLNSANNQVIASMDDNGFLAANGFVGDGYFISAAAGVTAALDAGLGLGGTGSVTGTAQRGEVTFTTGSTPTNNGLMITVNFPVPLPATSSLVWSVAGAHGSPSGSAGTIFMYSQSQSGFTLAMANPQANETYVVNWVAIG